MSFAWGRMAASAHVLPQKRDGPLAGGSGAETCTVPFNGFSTAILDDRFDLDGTDDGRFVVGTGRGGLVVLSGETVLTVRNHTYYDFYGEVTSRRGHLVTFDLDDLAEQCHSTAGIARTKYRHVRNAYLAFFVALPFWVCREEGLPPWLAPGRSPSG